jgi:hypothetical protein
MTDELPAKSKNDIARFKKNENGEFPVTFEFITIIFLKPAFSSTSLIVFDEKLYVWTIAGESLKMRLRGI